DRSKHPIDLPQATVMFTQVGADGTAVVSGNTQLPGRTNYFLGNDATRWARNVSTYSGVAVAGEYPGITLNYDGAGRGLEEIYTVATGASATAIRVQIDGATGITLTPSGDLTIATSVGPITEPHPQAYQDTP